VVSFLVVRDCLQFEPGLIVLGPTVVNMISDDADELYSSDASGTKLRARS